MTIGLTKELVRKSMAVWDTLQLVANIEAVNPGISPMQQELLDKHYLRKHGKNAYYGQG